MKKIFSNMGKVTKLNKYTFVSFQSTLSQAISIGQQANAKFILLTHFSQRYAKVPRMTSEHPDNIGIAFDNMRVR